MFFLSIIHVLVEEEILNGAIVSFIYSIIMMHT